MVKHFALYDAGGSNLRVQIADSDRNILSTFKRELKGTVGKDLPEFYGDTIAMALDKVPGKIVKNLAMIVGSQAGVCDSVNGILRKASNVTAADDVSFKVLGDRFATRYKLFNDGNIATYGVFLYERLVRENGWHTIMDIIMGTGIGGGIVINGQPFEGAFGQGLEVGHMTIRPEGYPCGCAPGRRGCWERYASGSGVEHIAEVEYGHKATAKEIFATARRYAERKDGDDAWADILVSQLAENNALALSNLIMLFNPQAIFCSESMMKDADLILSERMKTSLAKIGRVSTMPYIGKTEVEDPALKGCLEYAIRNAT